MIMSTPKETKDSIMTSQHHSIPFIGDYSSLSSSNSEEEEEKEEEDELNDGRKGKGGIIILKPRPLPESEPPIDHNQLVYVSMILAGVGFLLPYNSFIVAVDYYQDKFGGTIIFDLSVTYILTSFIAVILNNMLVESVSVHFRITSERCQENPYRNKKALSSLCCIFSPFLLVEVEIAGGVDLCGIPIMATICQDHKESFTSR
ncbi:SLC29A4 [Lepeophtheirus salmonis]|uniref:SLC29A4 n=1 Tax=Lepeophtheirus salmonis TaxID=72036 RepID=A0A7R8GZD4_LEPSM|nr:SLC29A4 [Lepeophtheirus salmonis]CAF2763919.1 SLC29A4 [Lepeophtheirus salmonis]